MISADPAADWDRYCRDQDQPFPVGPQRLVKSTKQQTCESCRGKIEPGTPHLMQAMINDIGLFSTPMRLHKEGECLPDDGEWYV